MYEIPEDINVLVSFANIEEGLENQIEPPHYPSPDELIPEQQLKQMIYEDVPEPARAIFMRQFLINIHPVQPFNPFKPIKSDTNYAEYFQTFEIEVFQIN